MKIQVTNYTFDPIGKTIMFTDYSSILLESVLLIVNATTNQIIYNFANPATGGSVLGNVLLLDFDTTAMSAEDSLMIYYDSDSAPSSDESIILLRRMVKIMESLTVVDANQRQRVTIDSITGSLVLATVSTVGNVNAFGGSDARYQLIDIARNTYANGIRKNLEFT